VNSGDPIEIEPLSSGNQEQLLAFYAAHMDDWDRFQQLWEWRRERESNCGAEKAVLARAGSAIVGSVGVVPLTVTLAGSKFTAAWQQDSLVSPAARGKGVGKRLVEKGMEGCEITLAKGTSDAMYRLRKKIGFRDVPRSDYLLQAMRPRLDASGLNRSAVQLLFWLWGKALPRPASPQNIQIYPIEGFDPGFDFLAEAICAENVLRPYKDHRYLNWRYFRCPGKDYTVLRAGDTQARGAVVLSMSNSDRGSGWVVDLICRSDDTACALALIGKAMAHFRSKHATTVWVFATHPRARRWFQRFGFLPTGQSPRFTYLVSGAGSSRPGVSERLWNFWHGDGDNELYM
jgi:GNAT superfamily N-acetyltransferase